MPRGARDRARGQGPPERGELPGRLLLLPLEVVPGAIDRFRDVLANDPEFTRRDAVYYHLAESLYRTDKKAEALPYYERLLREFETERVPRSRRRNASRSSRAGPPPESRSVMRQVARVRRPRDGAALLLAAAQALGPRTLLPMHVACADIAGHDAADGRQVHGRGIAARAMAAMAMATGDMVVIEAGTDAGRGGRPALRGPPARRRRHRQQAFRRRSDGYAGIRTAALADGHGGGRPLRAGAHRSRLRRGRGRRLPRADRACRRCRRRRRRGRARLLGSRAACCSGPTSASMFGDGDVLAINRGIGARRGAPARASRSTATAHNGLPLGELGEAVVIDVTESDVARGGRAGARLRVELGDVAVMRGAVRSLATSPCGCHARRSRYAAPSALR